MTVMTEAEFRQIFRAADAGQPFVLFEKAFQGDGGGGLAALDQFFDGGVNSFMRGDEKMILAQEIADLLHRPVVDQQRAEQSLLRLHIVRQHAVGGLLFPFGGGLFRGRGGMIVFKTRG
jgi:hypothetical protein